MQYFGSIFASLIIATCYFCTGFAQTPSATAAPASPVAAQASQTTGSLIAVIDPKDLADWRAAELANTRESYTAYLAAHPEGWFKPVAVSNLESGIPAFVGERPFAGVPNPSRKQQAQIAQWEDRVWQSAKEVGTHMAARDYFVRVQNGAQLVAATNLFLQTRPKLPEGIPVDCKEDEVQPRTTVRFDIVRTYPQTAIDQGQSGSASGEILVDRSGLPLALINAVYRNPNAFAKSILEGISRVRFAPLRAGCLVGQPVSRFYVGFELG